MLNIDSSILIVTDIQGKLASLMHDRDALYRKIGIMIEGIKVLEIPILWIEQYPRGLGPTVPEIASHLEEYEPLAKKTFSLLKDPVISKRFFVASIEFVLCPYSNVMKIVGHVIFFLKYSEYSFLFQ